MAVPAPTLLTIPLADPIVITEVLLLLHVPPDMPSLKLIVIPGHILTTPLTAAGDGLTVAIAVAIQPVGNV